MIKRGEALLVEQEDIYPACTQQKLHMLNIGLRDIVKEISGIKPVSLDLDFSISKFR